MTARPFLVLQLRPETDASDGEFAAILDKGGLAAAEVRRIRLDRETLPADLDLTAFAGVVVGGGPGCVSDPPADKSPLDARIEAGILGLMPQVTQGDIPFLGCCYGMGILAHHLGAPVSKARYGEPVGAVTVARTAAGRTDPLLADLPDAFPALVGHKEAVQSLPDGVVHLLASDPCPVQMIRYRSNVYATQFHPEADAAVFAERIRIYRHHGYFPPETAASLTAAVAAHRIADAPRILEAFVARYRNR